MYVLYNKAKNQLNLAYDLCWLYYGAFSYVGVL